MQAVFRSVVLARFLYASPANYYKSSAVAEMGDCGHNRHEPKRRKRRGGCCAPFGGPGTPSSTIWPNSIQYDFSDYPRDHPSHLVLRRPPFGEGDWVSIQHKVTWAEAYIHTKWHVDTASRLATIETGRKLGRGLRPLLGKGLAPHLTQSRQG